MTQPVLCGEAIAGMLLYISVLNSAPDSGSAGCIKDGSRSPASAEILEFPPLHCCPLYSDNLPLPSGGLPTPRKIERRLFPTSSQRLGHPDPVAPVLTGVLQ